MKMTPPPKKKKKKKKLDRDLPQTHPGAPGGWEGGILNISVLSHRSELRGRESLFSIYPGV